MAGSVLSGFVESHIPFPVGLIAHKDIDRVVGILLAALVVVLDLLKGLAVVDSVDQHHDVGSSVVARRDGFEARLARSVPYLEFAHSAAHLHDAPDLEVNT